jgi:hypothetical protein
MCSMISLELFICNKFLAIGLTTGRVPS